MATSTIKAELSTLNRFGGGVDIRAYNDSSNKYTAPSDGYLIGETRSDVINVKVYGNNEGQTEMTCLLNIGIPVFIRKGMKLYISSNASNRYTFFIPLY